MRLLNLWEVRHTKEREMSDFLPLVSAFCFGVAAGIMWQTYLACRDGGYVGNNGKRYRLTEVESPALCESKND